jgi:hypothetical protein
MDTGSKVGVSEAEKISQMLGSASYEPPSVVALGNVHDLLAGTGTRFSDAVGDCPATGTTPTDICP